MLYQDSIEMVEYIQQALRQASHEATVLLYSPGIDPPLETLLKALIECFTLKRGQEIHCEADC